jgi:hypothetical protein
LHRAEISFFKEARLAPSVEVQEANDPTSFSPLELMKFLVPVAKGACF